MLDSDLAELYGVETRILNQAVKRNAERFPERFVFKLTIEDMQILKSQFVISSWGGRRKPVFAFSEQGVAMLSSVLRSEKAIEISLKIIDAFVAMRSFLYENKELFIDNHMIRSKLFEHENKISYILDELKSKDLPEKGVFFEGQIFDAYKLLSEIIKKAKQRIILFDNYVDESTLKLFSDKEKIVSVKIYTKNTTEKLLLAIKKFNEQHKGLEVFVFDKSHDRFLIIDDEVYHFGASLKDLGKKWFAFSKLEFDTMLILDRISK
jgi:hypothetical protein